MVLELPVHPAHVPPYGMVLGAEAAARLGRDGVGVGDLVQTPHGPRTVVEVREGGAEAWAADGDSQPWMIAVGARAVERIRVHGSAVDDPEGYDPVHHTPIHGEPMASGVLDWLRTRGAAAILEDVAWRQDHVALARIAARLRTSGERPGAPWQVLADRPDLGMGRIREGMDAMAFVLGLRIGVGPDGVGLGLMRRGSPEGWSSGRILTAGAFRSGTPAPGGMHDPARVGTPDTLRFAHVVLPWPMVPSHLLPWVAQWLGESPASLSVRLATDGAASITAPLADALAALDPRPMTLDGSPIRASDVLWTEVPVVPAAFRRSVRRRGQRVPHGLDGTLHALINTVRQREKLGELRPELEIEMRRRVQRALDGYLTEGPLPSGWGWSVAQDLQGTLQVDGVMVDWGGHAVARVEPGRRRVGLPSAFAGILLDPDRPEAVLLVHMPDGVAAVTPELVDGPLILLPLAVAGSLGARTGDLVRVVLGVSREAQAEIVGLAGGLRMSPLVPHPGWLDGLAATPVDGLGAALMSVVRDGAVDRCQGPVGSRIWAGILPTLRGTDDEEVERMQRGLALLMRTVEGPGTTLPPGAPADRLAAAEEALGRSLAPEVRSLWSMHDGQLGEAPMLALDGMRWRLLPLDPGLVVGGRIPLAEGDEAEQLHVDAQGRVWRGDTVLSHSLGRLLQLCIAAG